MRSRLIHGLDWLFRHEFRLRNWSYRRRYAGWDMVRAAEDFWVDSRMLWLGVSLYAPNTHLLDLIGEK